VSDPGSRRRSTPTCMTGAPRSESTR
jgi:hypothetical protein